MRISYWSSDVCSSDLLGPRLKYSCCLYPHGTETLEQAEEQMFRMYAVRAGLVDGQSMLDLGCGWGSLSLWLAERYPASRIVGLSNSHGQREYIMARAKERGLHNLTILTGNIVDFEMSRSEEHTSELQSLIRISYAVFCLKKKH